MREKLLVAVVMVVVAISAVVVGTARGATNAKNTNEYYYSGALLVASTSGVSVNAYNPTSTPKKITVEATDAISGELLIPACTELTCPSTKTIGPRRFDSVDYNIEESPRVIHIRVIAPAGKKVVMTLEFAGIGRATQVFSPNDWLIKAT